MDVSVVIPTLNEENNLGLLLSDLDRQGRPADEVIVVDGRSEDRTASVAREFPNVRLLVASPSISRQRNVGGREAGGGILLFLDADVRLKESFLEDFLAAFERRKLDLACPFYMVPRSSALSTKGVYVACNALFLLVKNTLPSGSGQGIAVRREAFLESGGFDESLNMGEDVELIRRIAYRHKFGIIARSVFVSDRRFREYGILWMSLLLGALSFIFTVGRFEWANRINYEFGHHDREAERRMEHAIEVTDLTKTYPGGVEALGGVSFEVIPAEIFGILGPNGAGKTTTLEVLEGLRKPDSGEVRVAGYDVLTEAGQLKKIIGVQLQSTALFDHLDVRETLKLFADLYGTDGSKARIEELLAMVSLEEKAGTRTNELSGGQQQRLSIALALVNDPRIVFLDEPTTGLDPQARRRLWDLVREIRERGKTVVLTTHYMEEAETLCDRVAVMDHGRVVACDTPSGLIRALEMEATVFATVRGDLDGALDNLPGGAGVEREGADLWLRTDDVPRTIAGVMEAAAGQGARVENLSIRSPNLEDVFLFYTGRSLRER